MALFVDGVKLGTISNPSLPSSFLDTQIGIGSRPDTGTDQGNTQYDDFRFSSTWRNDTAISAYNNSQPLPADDYTTYKLNFDGNLSPSNGGGYQPDSWTAYTPGGSINGVIYDSTAPFGGSNVLHINPGSNSNASQTSTNFIDLSLGIGSKADFTLSGYLRAVPIGSWC